MACTSHKNALAKKKDPLKNSTFKNGKIKRTDKCNLHLLKLELLKKYIQQLEVRLKDRRQFQESLNKLDSLHLTE